MLIAIVPRGHIQRPGHLSSPLPMQAFVTLLPLLFLVLFLVGVVVYARKKHGKETPGPQGQTPYGIHGVLSFFIYTSLTFGPLMLVGTTMQNLTQAETATPDLLALPAWHTYKQLAWTQVAMLLAACWFFVLRLRNRLVPSSVRDIKLFLLLVPPASLVMELAAMQIAFGAVDTRDLAGPIGKMIVVNTVWFLYFQFSKRVRNTYYPPKGAPAPVVPAGQTDTYAWRWEEGRTAASQPAPQPAGTPSAAHAPGGAQERLTTLKQLREQGLITADDYERKKAEVLANL